jgi:hypothetical protein
MSDKRLAEKREKVKAAIKRLEIGLKYGSDMESSFDSCVQDAICVLLSMPKKTSELLEAAKLVLELVERAAKKYEMFPWTRVLVYLSLLKTAIAKTTGEEK